MADIFISYSRRDKVFVHRLDEALMGRGREAWVDWEGIRPTEEFMQAIYRAIEAADRTARMWEVTTGKQLARMEHPDTVKTVLLSSDGKYLAHHS